MSTKSRGCKHARLRKGCWEELLDDLDLGSLLCSQVVPSGLGILPDRVSALLDHLVQHGQDLAVIELDAFVYLALLDCREHQPNDA